ncbi:MAG: acyl-CoA dehydrogenase family protein [Pseudomonadota bacterium]
MALILDQDQQMLREAAKGFLAAKSPVAALRRLRDSADADGFSRSLWREMAEMGWAGILIPENEGGSGFGYVGAGLILEEMGRTLTASPFFATAVLGATLIAKGGNDAQKAALLPAIAQGTLLTALACDEQARHAPQVVRTRAEASGNGFKLTGEKTFVLDGHVADKLIIAARIQGEADARQGITLFLVDRGAPGLAIARTVMVDSRNAARLRLDGVQVAGDDVLGEIGGGYRLLSGALDVGRICLSAEMLGLASEAFDRTLGYLKEREQFGRKIGSFQGLQHRAARLFGEIELTRSAVLKGLQALDEAAPMTAPLASMIKAKAGETARLATNEAVQMHGGIGMSDEFDIGFFMKRARVARETFGDDAFHGDRLARLAGY